MACVMPVMPGMMNGDMMDCFPPSDAQHQSDYDFYARQMREEEEKQAMELASQVESDDSDSEWSESCERPKKKRKSKKGYGHFTMAQVLNILNHGRSLSATEDAVADPGLHPMTPLVLCLSCDACSAGARPLH